MALGDEQRLLALPAQGTRWPRVGRVWTRGEGHWIGGESREWSRGGAGRRQNHRLGVPAACREQPRRPGSPGSHRAVDAPTGHTYWTTSGLCRAGGHRALAPVGTHSSGPNSRCSAPRLEGCSPGSFPRVETLPRALATAASSFLPFSLLPIQAQSPGCRLPQPACSPLQAAGCRAVSALR